MDVDEDNVVDEEGTAPVPETVPKPVPEQCSYSEHVTDNYNSADTDEETSITPEESDQLPNAQRRESGESLEDSIEPERPASEDNTNDLLTNSSEATEDGYHYPLTYSSEVTEDDSTDLLPPSREAVLKSMHKLGMPNIR